MSKQGWSLPELLSGLHKGIGSRLAVARALLKHPVMKGDASELIWLEFLKQYLPSRYQVSRAFVVDSKNQFSEQIDIVIHDRHFTPFVFQHEGQTVVPAESVYAVFETKQSLNARQIKYAAKKICSVRKLHRTSLPIPTANGKAEAKTPQHIIGGILTLSSDWTPALGIPLTKALGNNGGDHHLDIGCLASEGVFFDKEGGDYDFVEAGQPVTIFLFELIARLQESATVPMIDLRAYAKWIK